METIVSNREKNIICTFSSFDLEKTPSYVSEVENFTGILDSLYDIYKVRENIICDLMTGTVMAYRENNPAIKFQELANTVESECLLSSSPSQIALHPVYQEIIGMGKRVLPLLIKRLKRYPTIWLWALESIAGVNPVSKENRGNIPAMIKDWENWYNQQFYARTTRFYY